MRPFYILNIVAVIFMSCQIRSMDFELKQFSGKRVSDTEDYENDSEPNLAPRVKSNPIPIRTNIVENFSTHNGSDDEPPSIHFPHKPHAHSPYSSTANKRFSSESMNGSFVWIPGIDSKYAWPSSLPCSKAISRSALRSRRVYM